MSSRLQIPNDDSVLLHVTHSNLKNFFSEVRFSPEMTVESAKEKLWRKCGTSVDSMNLELYDDTGAKVCDLDDNVRPLGFYSPLDGRWSSCEDPLTSDNKKGLFFSSSSFFWYQLHVIDLDPSSVTSGGCLEEISLVEKYTISEEAYNKLDGTFRKFKEKLVTQNPSLLESKIPDNYMEELCTTIKVGDRCEVEPGAKRGVVKFVGRADTSAPGFWVGIQYDEPLGKHDGMVKGKRYFNCPASHGALVRPDKVKVGDYPERDPFEEDEI